MKVKIVGAVGGGAWLALLVSRVFEDRENKQMSEPVQFAVRDSNTQKLSWPVSGRSYWVFRNRIVQVDNDTSEVHQAIFMRVKHKVLSEEKAFAKLKREVELFEKFERASPTKREPIPADVRMFVWQRDQGRCVQCGSNVHLEYDHIIALANGGSNTERNIQLLCEVCNRAKGTTI